MNTVLKEDWANIEDSHKEVFHTRGYRYLPVRCVAPRDFYIGKDSSNQPCLMFRVKKGLLEDRTFPDTEGLEVRIDFGFGEKELGVVLKLKSEDFLDVFTSLTNDLISSLHDLNNDKEFIDTFFGRLGIWKMFLDKSGPKGLGSERRRGLFGELYLLKEVILNEYGSEGLKFWTGPTGAMHDFEIGTFAIECKTMAGNKSRKVTISNERQLEDAGYDALYFARLPLTVRKNATPTLVSLIKEIEGSLVKDPLNLVNFRNSLLSSGYNAIHEDSYQHEGYHVDEILLFKVTDGFPRLLAKDLAEGVGGLNYTVDLSACTAFKTPYETLLSRLAELKAK